MEPFPYSHESVFNLKLQVDDLKQPVKCKQSPLDYKIEVTILKKLKELPTW